GVCQPAIRGQPTLPPLVDADFDLGGEHLYGGLGGDQPDQRRLVVLVSIQRQGEGPGSRLSVAAEGLLLAASRRNGPLLRLSPRQPLGVLVLAQEDPLLSQRRPQLRQ